MTIIKEREEEKERKILSSLILRISLPNNTC
jgi:hypothetical protein